MTHEMEIKFLIFLKKEYVGEWHVVLFRSIEAWTAGGFELLIYISIGSSLSLN